MRECRSRQKLIRCTSDITNNQGSATPVDVGLDIAQIPREITIGEIDDPPQCTS